jgi:threonine/homoserine/homoserine lactone efflux protein
MDHRGRLVSETGNCPTPGCNGFGVLATRIARCGKQSREQEHMSLILAVRPETVTPTVTLAFVGTSLLMLMTPGPSLAMLSEQSLRHGRAAGMAAVIGNITGSLMWIGAAILGLAAVLRTSETAFTVLKITGAVYLCWMGIRSLINSKSIRAEQPTTQSVQQESDKRTLAAAYRVGLLTNATNPKVAVVYLVLFPQFLPTGGNHLLNFMVLAVVELAITIGWYSIVVLAVDRVRRALSKPVVKARLVQASGLVFLALGLQMVTLTRAIFSG